MDKRLQKLMRGVAQMALVASLGLTAAPAAMAQPARPAGVPAAGQSPRIDAILKRGTLRVGVTPVFPWLFRNKSGSGDPFRGSSWVLAKADAAALGVKLETVQVTNETKIPLLLSGGIDITISSISPNPDRDKVIDLVPYSSDTFCIFGLKTDAKLGGLPSLAVLNNPDVIGAAYAGTNQYVWIKSQFPKAQLRGVIGSGQAPLDEILSGRADFVVADSPQEPIFKSAHGNLISFPSDCTTSHLNEAIVGHAIAKHQPAFLAFLLGVEKSVDAKVHQEDLNSIKFAYAHPDQL